MAIEEDKIKQLEGKSDFFNDILDKIPVWIIRRGNMLMLIIFLLLGIGAYFIKYPEVITAQAVITSDNPPVEVFTRTSGRISKFLKEDKEEVKEGDWVFILNNSSDEKEVKKVIEIIEELDMVDFWSKIDTLNLPKYNHLGDIQLNYFKLNRSINEFKLFKKLNPQVNHLSINKRRESNLYSIEKKLLEQLKRLKQEKDIVKSELNRYKTLKNNNYSSKEEYEKKEIAFIEVKNKIGGAEEQVLNVKMQIESVRKENTDLKTEKNDTYFKLRTGIMESYNSLLSDISDWQNKYVVIAPIGGVLNLFETRNTQKFLTNEQKVFTINTPVSQEYFALVKLPAENSGKLAVGQNCVIKLHNYPFREYGLVKGKIESFTSIPQEGFYTAKIKLENQLTTSTGKKLKARNGLTGSTEIIVKNYTTFDRLFNFLTSKSY